MTLPRLACALTLAATAALAALPAAAANRFDGRYHHSIDQCRSADATILRNGRISFHGGDCMLTSPTQVRGMSALLFDMVCPMQGGGSASERVMLSFDPEGGLLMVREGAWHSWAPCR